MQRRVQRLSKIFSVLAVLLACLTPGLAGADAADIQVIPHKVEIGTFFQGARLTVKAGIPRGAQAVVEVMGQPSAESLLRKGRRGFLWMNVGEIQVQGAPSLYLVASTDPRLLSTRKENPWGYEALQRQITFSGRVNEGEETMLFLQFLQLKESEGTYDTSANPEKVTNSPQDQPVAEANFWIPAKVAPGTYRVSFWVVQDGQVVSRKFTELTVLKVGFPALFSALAREHGALYGVLAVGIALAAGFVMGLIFKGGSH